MRRYLALCEEWAQRPPTRWLKAAELGYKPPSRTQNAAGVHSMPKLKPTNPISSEALERKRREIILAARARGEPTMSLPEEEAAGQPTAKPDGFAEILRRNGGIWRG
jgi:hypothetical protein